jgi:succinate dehydrogenase hydrophobic anchor subunit
MQLLNLSFAILIIKISFCVLPGVLGIYLIVSSEEAKRGLRNSFCSKLFDISNAIAYPRFERFMNISGVILLLFSAAGIWFLLLRDFFVK